MSWWTKFLGGNKWRRVENASQQEKPISEPKAHPDKAPKTQRNTHSSGMGTRGSRRRDSTPSLPIPVMDESDDGTLFKFANFLVSTPVYVPEESKLVMETRVPGDNPNQISTLTLPQKELKHIYNLGDRSLDFLFYPGRHAIIGFSEGAATVWDLASGAELGSMEIPSQGRAYLRVKACISVNEPSSAIVVVYASHEEGLETIVLRIDATTWSMREQWARRSGEFPEHAVLSPDGTSIAFGYSGGKVIVHDVVNGDVIGHFESDQKGVSMKSGLLALGCSDDVSHLAFSEDGDRIAVGYQGGGIEVFALDSPKAQLTLSGHSNSDAYGRRIMLLVWHRDGKRLTSVGRDDVISTWSLDDGRCLRRTRPRVALVIGDTILHGENNTILEIGEPRDKDTDSDPEAYDYCFRTEGEDDEICSCFVTWIRSRELIEEPGLHGIESYVPDTKEEQHETCEFCYFCMPCRYVALAPPPEIGKWPDNAGICNLGQMRPFVADPGMKIRLVKFHDKACPDFKAS